MTTLLLVAKQDLVQISNNHTYDNEDDLTDYEDDDDDKYDDYIAFCRTKSGEINKYNERVHNKDHNKLDFLGEQ